MAYENLLLQIEDGLAVLTINRPKVLNALSYDTIGELIAALGEVEKSSARVLILTGAGPRAFVAGADINELRVLKPREAEGVMRRAQELLFDLENSRLVVIMAINGYALGGGCELAMAGDIRVASDNARLGQPEVNLGLIPGFGGTQRLPRLVGTGQAMRLVLTGEHIPALEAREIGLVEVVVCHRCGQRVPGRPCHGAECDCAECEHEQHCEHCGQPVDLCPECGEPTGMCRCQSEESAALRAARQLAQTILQKGPVAVEVAKRCIRVGAETTIEKAGAFEMAQFGLICSTEDKVEGTGAFLEKRPPEFKGR